jgi:hypothetical protein
MNQGDSVPAYAKQEAASYLLPDPGGEVLREFISMLRNREDRVAKLESVLGQFAAMRLDGEAMEDDEAPFEMTCDDAFATVHSVITLSRETLNPTRPEGM